MTPFILPYSCIFYPKKKIYLIFSADSVLLAHHLPFCYVFALLYFMQRHGKTGKSEREREKFLCIWENPHSENLFSTAPWHFHNIQDENFCYKQTRKAHRDEWKRINFKRTFGFAQKQ